MQGIDPAQELRRLVAERRQDRHESVLPSEADLQTMRVLLEQDTQEQARRAAAAAAFSSPAPRPAAAAAPRPSAPADGSARPSAFPGVVRAPASAAPSVAAPTTSAQSELRAESAEFVPQARPSATAAAGPRPLAVRPPVQAAAGPRPTQAAAASAAVRPPPVATPVVPAPRPVRPLAPATAAAPAPATAAAPAGAPLTFEEGDQLLRMNEHNQFKGQHNFWFDFMYTYIVNVQSAGAYCNMSGFLLGLPFFPGFKVPHPPPEFGGLDPQSARLPPFSARHTV